MQYHLMYNNISYFLLDVRANQSGRGLIPRSIDSFEKYSTFVYFTSIISSHIRIYLLFSFGFCANRADRAWVSWSIDSSENTLYSCTLHLISSHVLRYLLFSFGCSGEPVQSCVSYLKYRFLWKIQHIRVLYMHNIISYTHISVIFLWMFGELARPRVSSLEYRFLWKYTIFVYFTSNIISYTQISLIFFWMFGRTSTQSCVSSLKYRFLWKYTIQHFVYFTSNIISYTHICTVIFFWMFGRTSPVVREFPGV